MLAILLAFASAMPPLGEIAYMHGGKVWLVREDGSDRRKLADASYDRPLVWSPDGQKLLYWKEDPNWQLYQVEPDSGKVLNLTQSRTADNRAASYSPDGKRIAYLSGEKGLCLIGSDGQGLQILSPKGHRDARPYWTDDGSIVFQDLENSRLSLCRFDFGQKKDLPLVVAATYAVSPNGQTLAYAPNRLEGGDLILHDLKSGREKSLASRGHHFSEIRWSVTGDLLILRSFSPAHQLMVISSKGGQYRFLTDLQERGWVGFDLSPDAKRYVFSNGQRGKETIFVSDVAKGRPRSIGEGVWPTWRPRPARP